MKQENKNMSYRSYMSLLSLNYQRLYSYVLLLTANHTIADDIMQETSILMYEKFTSFEEGTDFLAWAKTIARYKTFDYLKKKKREKIVFNQDLIDLIDQESSRRQIKHDDWLDALRKCVSLLPKIDRRLVNIRYNENVSVKDIASRIGCSFQKVYRNMARINGSLLKCVRQKIETGDY